MKRLLILFILLCGCTQSNYIPVQTEIIFDKHSFVFDSKSRIINKTMFNYEIEPRYNDAPIYVLKSGDWTEIRNDNFDDHVIKERVRLVIK